MRVSRTVLERAAAALEECAAQNGCAHLMRSLAADLVQAVLDAALEPNMKAPSETDVEHARMCGDKGYIPRYGCVLLEGDGD